jgi:hypothetical protein
MTEQWVSKLSHNDQEIETKDFSWIQISEKSSNFPGSLVLICSRKSQSLSNLTWIPEEIILFEILWTIGV